MIKVHRMDGTAVYINPTYIAQFRESTVVKDECHSHTYISFANNDDGVLFESPEEIIKLIKEEK